MGKQQTLIGAEGDGEDIKTLRCVCPAGVLGEKSVGRLSDTLLFGRIDGENGGGSIVCGAESDLEKDEGFAVLSDQVDLTPSRAQIALNRADVPLCEPEDGDVFGGLAAFCGSVFARFGRESR